jgi:hypothetical protein
MANPKDPLKPITLRGKPLRPQTAKDPAPPPAEDKEPKSTISLFTSPGDSSKAVIREKSDGVEINLEQAYAESRRAAEVIPKTGLPRPGAPRVAGAPPPSGAVAQSLVTAPPPTMPSRKPGVSTRATNRRPCSIPGMLRILLPEQSFEPQVFAVRVVEISSTGARVETRQLTEELHRLLSLEVRYIRLEILIPARERLVISGKLAWMEYQPDSSQMGISFHPNREDLTSLCMPEWRPQGSDESSFVSPPVVDSYPPTTSKTPFTFTGHALDADMVVVKGKTEEYRVPVESGRFEVTIPLVPGTANELIFVAMVGEMASDPTPVWIIHRLQGDDAQGRKAIAGVFREAVVGQNGRHLRVRFTGDGRDLVQALRRLEETASQGDSFDLTFEMTGDAERALSTIKKAGAFPWGVGTG